VSPGATPLVIDWQDTALAAVFDSRSEGRPGASAPTLPVAEPLVTDEPSADDVTARPRWPPPTSGAPDAPLRARATRLDG